MLSLYRILTFCAAPLLPPLLAHRRNRGKEDIARIGERLGRATQMRPEGRLIWIHGASVGECVAAIPLIEKLLTRKMGQVLVTSGTVTSSVAMAKRLPVGAFHQFVPVDTPAATARFLDHWRPDIGLFVDSDIWPNLTGAAHARGIPLAVVNARMSERSFRHWKWVPKTARAVLDAFDAVLAQDEEIAGRFRALGAQDVRVCGSLKADAAPLAVDAAELGRLRTEIGKRPVFVAAQTHAGEEETLIPARDRLARQFPGLLTVIVPRHVGRAEQIAGLCGTRVCARRSLGEPITPETDVYIADTMGEMGLFYRLASFAFVGGSLIPHGGQNPLEPARLGCAVLAGPHVFNFTVAYRAIHAAQGTEAVTTSVGIAEAAGRLLAAPDVARALGEKAAAGAAALAGASARTVEYVEGVLDHAGA